MITLVENWKQIIENNNSFQEIFDNHENNAYRRFSQFFHWYYFPESENFSPSKFIGYRNTTIHNYYGDGHGGETREKLYEFFIELDNKSEQYQILKEKLIEYSQLVGKKLSSKFLNNKGGIYTPKESYPRSKNNSIRINKSSIAELAIKDEKAEGDISYIWSTKTERNAYLREAAIKHHGTDCKVCGLNFEKVYGKLGEGFIEIHHLNPLSVSPGKRKTNPQKDLVPLCSNCHRMIHRLKPNEMTVEMLQKIIKKKQSKNKLYKPV